MAPEQESNSSYHTLPVAEEVIAPGKVQLLPSPSSSGSVSGSGSAVSSTVVSVPQENEEPLPVCVDPAQVCHTGGKRWFTEQVNCK